MEQLKSAVFEARFALLGWFSVFSVSFFVVERTWLWWAGMAFLPIMFVTISYVIAHSKN